MERLIAQKPFSSAAVKHGRKYEPMALKEYEKNARRTGRPVKVLKSGLFVSPNIPILGCSPDAKVIDLSKEISDIKIDENEVLVSFDVVSLFTAIPVDKPCDYIKIKLEQDASLPSRTNLDIDDIISLLQFTLSNNYFMFNDRIYKQVHGCTMGSPVSPVVANL